MDDLAPTLRVLAIGDPEHLRPALAALERDAGVAVTRAPAVPPSADADVVLLVAGSGAARAATSAARRACQHARVVVAVVDTPSDRLVADVMAAGASGVVAPGVDAEELARAVRRAASGEIVLPDHLLAALVSSVGPGRVRPDTGGVLDRLTPREREVLRSLAAGRSTVDIGADLGISTLTVQTHLKSILAKLGAHSKIEAITLAWREGLAPMPTTA